MSSERTSCLRWSFYRSGCRDLPILTSLAEPDEEIAVATLDPGDSSSCRAAGTFDRGRRGDLATEQADRPFARTAYLARYLGYLLDGANLVLIDVHRRPTAFSFADQIAAQLHLEQPPVPAPMAVSYRVGEPAATGGRLLAIWRRPLTVGAVLPALPLPLTPDQAVTIDLERTYSQAATDAYLT